MNLNNDSATNRMSGKAGKGSKEYTEIDMTPEMRKIIVNIAILVSKAVPVSHLALREIIIRAINQAQVDTRTTFSEAKTRGGAVFKQFYDALASNLKNALKPLANARIGETKEDIDRSVSEIAKYMNKFTAKRPVGIDPLKYDTRKETPPKKK